jgi:hypothetical protein
MHHPSLLADPFAPTTAQLPSSPLSQSDVVPPTVVLGGPRAPPAFVLANAQRTTGGIQPAIVRLDDRPIRPSGNGQYNLQFLDNVVDLEHYHERAYRGSRPWVAPAPEEADTRTRNAQPPLSRDVREFVHALGRPDHMTDAQFSAAFPYERLVELDHTIPASHRGLKPTELNHVLAAVVSLPQLASSPGEPQSASTLSSRTALANSSTEPFSCAICLSGSIASPSVPQGRRDSQESSSTLENAAGRDASTCVVRLVCGHMFHLGCIRDWLIGARTCPNCRVDVRPATSSIAPSAQPTNGRGRGRNDGGVTSLRH